MPERFYQFSDEEASLIIGIANHEYRTINYTIEVWLINQSTYFDKLTKENKTSIDHMWFIDKMTTTLKHEDIDIEKQWIPQWEHSSPTEEQKQQSTGHLSNRYS